MKWENQHFSVIFLYSNNENNSNANIFFWLVTCVSYHSLGPLNFACNLFLLLSPSLATYDVVYINYKTNFQSTPNICLVFSFGFLHFVEILRLRFLCVLVVSSTLQCFPFAIVDITVPCF